MPPGPFRPGRPPSARALNAAHEQARRAQNMRGGGLYGGFRSGPSGNDSYPIDPKGFWARLDDYDPDSGAYAWTEMQDDSDEPDAMVEATDGRVGTLDPLSLPLYEVNGRAAGLTATDAGGVERHAVVRAWPAVGSDVFHFDGGGGGGAGAVEMRITGRPKCAADGHQYYPAVPFLLDGTTDTAAAGTSGGWRDSTPAAWVRQNYDAPLGTDGNFVVWAVPDRYFATKDVSGDERPLYGTHDRIVVVNLTCVDDVVTPVFNGVYGGCDAASGMWSNGMFPSGMWADGMFP